VVGVDGIGGMVMTTVAGLGPPPSSPFSFDNSRPQPAHGKDTTEEGERSIKEY